MLFMFWIIETTIFIHSNIVSFTYFLQIEFLKYTVMQIM